MRLLYTVYHAPTPRLDPSEHTPRPSLPPGSDRWVVPREKGCPVALRLFLQGPREARLQRGSQSKTKKNPRLAHRDGWRKAVGDFSREGPRDDSISLPALLRSRACSPGPRTTPTPDTHTVSRSSEHMNFKMVPRPGVGGVRVRRERVKKARHEQAGAGIRMRPWVAGGALRVTRTSVGLEGGAPGKGGGRNGARPL